VTVCNSANYFFTYLAEHFSEPDTRAPPSARSPTLRPPQDDGVGCMGATSRPTAATPKGAPQFAQNQPYCAAITPTAAPIARRAARAGSSATPAAWTLSTA
jgi:hypothetical protein